MKNIIDIEKQILEASANLPFPEFDDRKAMDNVWSRIDNAPPKTHRMVSAWYIAALLLVGLLVGVTISTVLTLPKQNQFVEIEVKKGEKLLVRLPDGNKVWLNSNTRMKYPADFTGMNRRIDVEGEAFFEIKNQNAFPLMIFAQGTLMNCDSAFFNVKCSGQNASAQLEVTVQKGWVSLSNQQMGDSYVVRQNEVAMLSPDVPLFVCPAESPNYMAWKTGRLAFAQTPLKTVASELSKYFDTPVIVEGELQYCKFTSEYIDADMSVILADIQRDYQVGFIRSGEKLILRGGNGCP